ncbi:MAG: IS66 family transposase [Candidatus Latescibacteria bacterium]|nr:IS66 family transposase [Candidatus Latescibacterota bacterium]
MRTTVGSLPSDISSLQKIITEQAHEIDTLKHELSYIKRMLFGQKRERHNPSVPEEQMTLEGLFKQIGVSIPGFAESKEHISYDRRKPKKGHGRKAIPDDLHREKHILDVPEEEKICDCCGAQKKHIGDDITEELEYKPAVFFVNQYIKPKYACPNCSEQGVTMATMPARPIEKGVAGVGLLAYILVSKYVDHLPLYRLQQMFMRYSININRSTMSGWIAQICSYLKVIYEAMHRELIKDSFLIQADETTLKVLDKETKDKCELGYLWPYVGDGKLAVFEFKDSRAKAGPTDFLSGFTERYLMSDGYAGYGEVIRENRLKHLMCWAHARRKFFEVKDLEPEFVSKVLSHIGMLYAIEKTVTDEGLDHVERGKSRKEKSVPVLNAINELLRNPGKIILPNNKVSDAIVYTLNHWQQLIRLPEDGRLSIDNNLVENSIRPVALGRKNWLFAGSPEGAKRMAIIYSLVVTCKLNSINPYEYFYDILPKVASYPESRISDLIPTHWKNRKPEGMG